MPQPADISSQGPEPDSPHGYIPPDLHPEHREAFPEKLKTACAYCSYDLAALPKDAPACPECGTPIGDAWDEGRASFLSVTAVVISGLCLLTLGCTGGFSAALALPGLALGIWARKRALNGTDTPVSAIMALGAIIMSGIIVLISGILALSFLVIALI